MIRLQRIALVGGLTLFLGAAVTGCGGSTATVSGRVSYRGVALTNGGVMFHGADGSTAYGGIGPDGSYTARNVPRGPVRISVNVPMSAPPPARLPRGVLTSQLPGGWAVPQLSRPGEGATVPIPARYGRPESSGLSCVVEAGSQQDDIDLP
jgi:hypothetical protein